MRPLILLHGFTGDASTWRALLPHLGHDRPFLAIDLPGHGPSEAPTAVEAYSIPATVETILDGLDGQLLDPSLPRRLHWLGYSMGGRVALSLAAAAPERVASLSLIGASPGLTDPAERAARLQADAELAEFIRSAGIEAFVDRWMAHPLFASQARLGPDWLAEARAQRLRNQAEAMALSLLGGGTGSMPPLWEALPRIDCPTLLIAGALDQKFAGIASEMAARMPRARTLIVPNAGHAVHLEEPEALAAALRAFLDGLEAGPDQAP
jgi:2-succinyl-6-hydroxy-2,4-cyclohexadiene-1-carboxylate synthase